MQQWKTEAEAISVYRTWPPKLQVTLRAGGGEEDEHLYFLPHLRPPLALEAQIKHRKWQDGSLLCGAELICLPRGLGASGGWSRHSTGSGRPCQLVDGGVWRCCGCQAQGTNHREICQSLSLSLSPPVALQAPGVLVRSTELTFLSAAKHAAISSVPWNGPSLLCATWAAQHSPFLLLS